MSRKKLDDVIYGDRSDVRARKGGLTVVANDGWDYGYAHGGSTSYGHGRCYETHPPLLLPGGKQIFGGSCLSPIVKDADVYIGFDNGMKFGARSWPWKTGHEFLFHIADMRAPTSLVEFKKLLAWTMGQLEQGAKIHAGCIGGHGRTGTFLAALVAELGEPNAIAYVRKHYCRKAVESHEQSEFLVKHFGVTPAQGHKAVSRGTGSGAKAGAGRNTGGSVRIAPLADVNPYRIW